jgi:hypothetical protein
MSQTSLEHKKKLLWADLRFTLLYIRKHIHLKLLACSSVCKKQSKNPNLFVDSSPTQQSWEASQQNNNNNNNNNNFYLIYIVVFIIIVGETSLSHRNRLIRCGKQEQWLLCAWLCSGCSVVMPSSILSCRDWGNRVGTNTPNISWVRGGRLEIGTYISLTRGWSRVGDSRLVPRCHTWKW